MLSILVVLIILIILAYLFPVVNVHDHGMVGPLKYHKLYLSTRLFFNPKVGCIYSFYDPLDDPTRILVRRLTMIIDNEYYFSCDNPNVSYDSREFGTLARKDIISMIL